MVRFSFARRIRHKVGKVGQTVKTKASTLKSRLGGFASRIRRSRK